MDRVVKRRVETKVHPICITHVKQRPKLTVSSYFSFLDESIPVGNKLAANRIEWKHFRYDEEARDMGFLSGFTDRFAVALGVWPFASVIFTLPILAFLYNRDGKLRFWSVVGAYLSVLYALGLVFFTLWPLPSGDSGLGITYGVHPQFNPLGFIGDIRKDGLSAVFQIVANIVFFVPLGFIFHRGCRLGFAKSVLFSFAVSLLIETAQLTGLFGIYPYSYRAFDVDDLIWNTSGALIGWIVAKAIGKVLPVRSEDMRTIDLHPGLVHRSVAFILDMSIVGICSLCMTTGVSLIAYFIGFSGERAAEIVEIMGLITSIVVFIILEVVIPWIHDGQTPGGSFVRMSIESHERDASHRVMFYVTRIAVIAICFFFWPIALPIVLIYYLVARRMPYDAIA